MSAIFKMLLAIIQSIIDFLFGIVDSVYQRYTPRTNLAILDQSKEIEQNQELEELFEIMKKHAVNRNAECEKTHSMKPESGSSAYSYDTPTRGPSARSDREANDSFDESPTFGI